jgi:hypothetical protein
MLAVHGLWSPGRGILLWAEDGDHAVRSPSQAIRSARAHPFAAPVESLAEIHPGKPTTARILLPSLRSAPLDSAELVRATPRPAPQRPPALLPWTVPAILVDPAELDQPSPQLRYGASVSHLRAVVAFAADLAERGRLLPALVRESGAPAARWRPVVTGPDAVRLHSLVAAMPPVGRAEQDGRAGQPARIRSTWSPTRWRRSSTPPSGTGWPGRAGRSTCFPGEEAAARNGRRWRTCGWPR